MSDSRKCYMDFAAVYDNLLNKDIDYESWGNTILELCCEFGCAMDDYIDLACGTGNMLQVLARNFKNVWGLDLSYEMLSVAENKLRGKGIKAKLVCEDMCSLNLGRQYDLITCCLDSVNYIVEEDKLKSFFKSVNNVLKNDGLFIFDINSYYKISNILGDNLYNYDDESLVYIWENCFENEIVDMYLTFFIKEGELYKRFDEVHRERAYTEKMIESIITDAGLNVVTKLDNYEDKTVKECTERIVYVVKKEI